MTLVAVAAAWQRSKSSFDRCARVSEGDGFEEI